MKPGQLFNHWEQVRADLLATIDKFAEAELTYVPFEGSWPVGRIMLHVAECEDYWLHGVVRHEFELPVRYHLADHPTKASIKMVLFNAHSRTIEFLGSLSEEDLDLVYPTRFGESFSLYWII